MKDTIEMAFIDGKEMITTEDLLQSVKDTKSISSTLKEKIKEIKSTSEEKYQKLSAYHLKSGYFGRSGG